MIEILRKIFEDHPEKSTIVMKEKCSDCGRETILEITKTSGGFGLHGGLLFKSSTDRYIVKCPDCIKTSPKLDDKT
jgi:ribosomal protein S27E